MNGFLQHLITRNTAGLESVRPRLPGPFEPPLGGVGLWEPVLPAETAEEAEPEPAESVAPAQPSPHPRPVRPMSAYEPPRRVQPSSLSFPPPVTPEQPRPHEPLLRPDDGVRQVAPDVFPTVLPKESSGPPPATDLSPRPERPEPVSAPPPPGSLEMNRTSPPPASQGQEPPTTPETPRLRSAIDPQEQDQARPLTIEPIVRLRPAEASIESPANQEVLPITRQPDVQPQAQPARPRAVENGTGPTIQVTIGRVEVRAVFTQSTPQPPRPRPTPALSLDEYLKQRDGGGP